MTFQLADLGFHVELFSNPHSSCWKWGCWIWGFSFPASTFTRSWTLDFLRTDWPARYRYPHHGSFSLKEDPCGLCKGFGGSKGVNHLPTFFFSPLKKGRKKNSAQHTVSSQPISAQNSTVSQRGCSHGSLRRALVFKTQECGDRSACSSSSPLSTNFLRLQEWREWDSGDSSPLL